MRLPAGFRAVQVAVEPIVRQPLSVSFDDRGRMWVLQYLQYPNPAGLKPVKQDQYLRTIWDKVPDPPPHGPKGVDRITILSDPDASGRFRKAVDFLDDLNLATGFCLGNGGVYVVQPPYLLFYPDLNRDDRPDTKVPTVLLTGFGMEDTHSYANSLQFGPDGWLYGAHGSTVTAKIKNPADPSADPIEFQQGIWRYHPPTKRFELFAEGGGNTYGLDFDQYGRCIAGTNWGGFAMLHHVQGAYYVKGFAKHGPLHNPHTYGYFDHVPYKNFKGGHVTCGGVIYQADTYPPEYRNQYIAGNLLSNAVYRHDMTESGSTFTAKHGSDLMTTDDIWFRPVDCFQGPDGCIYVADWYDKRAAHLDPIDTWHKTSGRIYRIEYQGTKQPDSFDLNRSSDVQLLELLKHPNKWWRNEARRALVERKAVSVATINALEAMLRVPEPLPALEACWILSALGRFDDRHVLQCLGHTSEHVRAWAVRIVGDRVADHSESPGDRPRYVKPSDSIAQALLRIAKSDSSPVVRSQLACTAKRLDTRTCLELAAVLSARSEDAADPHIPHLVWWAIESRFGRPSTVFQHIPVRGQSAFDTFLAERIARRTVAADLASVKGGGMGNNGVLDFAFVRELSAKADPSAVPMLLKGIESALEGRAFAGSTVADQKWLSHLSSAFPDDDNSFRIRVRLNHGDARRMLLNRISDGKQTDAVRVRLIGLVGQLRRAEYATPMLELFRNPGSESVRAAALSAADSADSRATISMVQSQLPKLTGGLRAQSLRLMLSRPESAQKVMELVESKAIDARDVPVDLLRPTAEFDNSRINAIVLKHWGKIAAATPGEKQARISWLNIQLSRGSGDAKNGKQLFTKNCATCHTLFGEGQKVGPDLTAADRKNRGYLLAQIVDPSAHVRPEFVVHNVLTTNGKRLSGIVVESNASALTLLTVVENKEVRTQVPQSEVEDIKPSIVSLMPDKLLDTLKDEEVRDLFAYMQSDPPKDSKSPKDAPKSPVRNPAPSPVPGEKVGADAPKEPGGSAVRKIRVLLISGSLEYKSDETLTAFQKHLEEKYSVEVMRAFRKTDEDIPGLDALETCDVAVFFTRRLKITGEQLERVKKYVAAGKPIVGIRTASHGFQNWLEMDKEVFGGDYKGHYKDGPKCEVKNTDKSKDHPVMAGVKPFVSIGSLYKNAGIAKDCTVLQTGSIPDHQEPITWVREHKGGRVFYTSLGHPKDFDDSGFVRMLVNAIHWTAGRTVPK